MKTELSAATVEAIQLADEFPFNTIELCQNLESGGLTPSSGMVRYALENTAKKIHVLVRPRAGNFLYTDQEKNLMLNEIEALLLADCNAIVAGALLENGNPDLVFLRTIRESF